MAVRGDDDRDSDQLLSDSQFELEVDLKRSTGRTVVFIAGSVVVALLVATLALYALEIGPFEKPPPPLQAESAPPPAAEPPPVAPAPAPVAAPLPPPADAAKVTDSADDSKGKKGKAGKKKAGAKKRKKR